MKSSRQIWHSKAGTIIARTLVPKKIVDRIYTDLPLEFAAVACMGSVGDWAAYLGLPLQTNAYIYQHGDKIPADIAAELFPMLKKEFYRR